MIPSVPSRVLAVWLVVSSVAWSAQASAQGVVHRDEHRFRVGASPDLVLTTLDGSIRVDTWDQPDVLVVVEKRAPTMDVAKRMPVRVSQAGTRIEVTVPRADHPDPRTHGIGLVISVPRKATITADAGDGSIAVHGVAGRVAARTGDGAVTLTDVAGYVDLTTGDGAVAVSGVLEVLKVRTGDGTVSIVPRAGSRVVSEWDVRTGDGSVLIDCPPGFAAAFDIRTDGRIRLEGPPPTDPDERLRIVNVREEWEGRVGKGGGPIKIRTGDGPITLKNVLPRERR
jgi:hypothetical protein